MTTASVTHLVPGLPHMPHADVTKTTLVLRVTGAVNLTRSVIGFPPLLWIAAARPVVREETFARMEDNACWTLASFVTMLAAPPLTADTFAVGSRISKSICTASSVAYVRRPSAPMIPTADAKRLPLPASMLSRSMKAIRVRTNCVMFTRSGETPTFAASNV